MQTPEQSVKNAAKPKARGKPFEKGNKLGKGRPVRAIAIPDELRVIGEEPDEKNPLLTKFQAFCRKVYSMALDGDIDAVKFVAERTEGKVKDTIQVDGNETAPLVVVMPPTAQPKG